MILKDKKLGELFPNIILLLHETHLNVLIHFRLIS